ncbi:hypothetical protein, partial [Citrobacter amalonaticus]|uniref:hypothetical protein n=1 Tax=Citrobacter amalonaticus TaxID=35703 RepID=UPI002FE51728
VDVDQATPFIEAIDTSSGVCVAFIVTDDDRHFQSVTKRLPKDVEPVRLYESYLTNFSFTSGNGQNEIYSQGLSARCGT